VTTTCCGHEMARVEIRGVYDGALWCECGTCQRRAHRWPEGDWRREKAEALWRSYDAAMLEHAPTVSDVL
jgi:hypothetical protein